MNKFIVILLLIFCCSCTQKSDVVLSNGYDSMVFKYNINISTEITKNDLTVVISNYNQIMYKLWITYKYMGKTKKGYSRELLYEGNDFKKAILAKLPYYNEDIEQSMEIKIFDDNGEVIYDSPLIEL